MERDFDRLIASLARVGDITSSGHGGWQATYRMNGADTEQAELLNDQQSLNGFNRYLLKKVEEAVQHYPRLRRGAEYKVSIDPEQNVTIEVNGNATEFRANTTQFQALVQSVVDGADRRVKDAEKATHVTASLTARSQAEADDAVRNLRDHVLDSTQEGLATEINHAGAPNAPRRAPGAGTETRRLG
jgi:hypothetical protein